jgi:hypothetical protein
MVHAPGERCPCSERLLGSVSQAMASYKGTVVDLGCGNLAPRIDVEFFHPTDESKTPVRAPLIVDTGATKTIVVQEVLEALGLPVEGVTLVTRSTPDGGQVQEELNRYFIGIRHSDLGPMTQRIEVVPGTVLGAACLLGTDFLTAAAFHYDGPDGCFVLTW